MGTELALEADSELAEACEPRMRALDDPAMAAEPLAAVHATASNARGDAALGQRAATLRVVVALVGMDLVGSASRAPWQPAYRGHGIEQLLEEHRVVAVCSAHA